MNQKFLKYKNLLFNLLIIGLFFYVFGSNIGQVKVLIDQTIGDEVIGEISKGVEVKQTFRVDQNNFNGVSIKLATYARINHGHLLIGIKELKTGRSIYNTTVNTESIADNQYYDLRFPPIKNSKNKTYYIYIKSIDGEPGNSITLYSSSVDSYNEGELYINGSQKSGDIVFQVVYNQTILNCLVGV